MKWVVRCLVGLIVILTAASGASAHDPIILTDDQTGPESGPFLPDGTISFALYGSFDAAGETRGLRVQFVDGDRLHVSLLIPDLAPENALSDAELPRVEIADPDGGKTALTPELRREFAEPFTGTNYIELIDEIDVARSGIYSITVVGGAASRFTLSVGDKETFGTPVDGVTDRSAGVGGVMEWYAGVPVRDASKTETTNSQRTPQGSQPMPEQESWATTRLLLVFGLIVVVGLIVARRSRAFSWFRWGHQPKEN